MRTIRKLAALAALLAVPGMAAADTALKRLLTANDARGWTGVGRIDFGGRSFCTGALISDDLVLTAAHCLFEPGSGRRYRPDEITFLAGWRNGRAAAYRGARQAVDHPDYETETDRARRVADDVALIQLDQPVRKSSVKPFGTEGHPRKGAEVGVVSYAFDRTESPALQKVCHVLARQSGVLVLSCDIDFGSSGAPVFVMENGIAQIVSVISSKAEDVNGRKVALGTDLQRPLGDLMAILTQSDGVFVKATPPRIRSQAQHGVVAPAGGAKFLRP